MTEQVGPVVGPVARSVVLVARARVCAERSRELIATSRDLIAHSLVQSARHDDPPVVTSAPEPVTAPGLSISTAVALSGLDHMTLWLAYVSIGGDHSPLQVRSYLQGEMVLPAHDTRVLAHVVNEHFRQLGFSGPVSDG